MLNKNIFTTKDNKRSVFVNDTYKVINVAKTFLRKRLLSGFEKARFGEKVIKNSHSRSKRIAYGFMRGVGAGLIGFAVIGVLFSYGPVFREEIMFRLGFREQEVVESGFGKLIHFAEAEKTARIQEEAASFGVDSYFSVVIPKIDAAADVVVNVDTSNEEEYKAALKEGIAHARGTYFPGQGKAIYLFSHSTNSLANVSRYNAVFYLLNKMEKGDQIIVFFADSRYTYEVKELVRVEADDTRWLSYAPENETLLLQTCDPPGTTWRRLIVVAELVAVE